MYIVSEAQWKRIEEKPYASHWVLSSIGCGYLCVFRRIRRMTFAEIETGLGCKLPEDAREPYYNAGWSK